MTRRVLYLAWAPFFSGAERALLLTLRSLDPARYDPYVVAGTDGEFAAQVRAMGIPCDIAELRPMDVRHPLASARSVANVARAASRSRASLIHANEVPSFQPGGYAARLLGVPAVTHVRFFDRAAGYRWFLRSQFTRALFVSNDLMASARGEAPDLFDGRSDVLYDAVEPQPVWTDERKIATRASLGLPVDRTIVALTGQIAEIKGIWEFIDAARILASRGTEPFFAVLGDDLKNGGSTRRAMEERVAALGLGDRFRFLGFRKDAPQIVQAFDIIAVPSHVEPLGNATLEAMAAGRPVVGTRVGGIPEMIVDGETGSLVPPRDPASLADAIAAIVLDCRVRQRMSGAARLRAIEQFSLQAHGRRLQAHYDALQSLGVAAPAATGEVA
ncbi:MAG TPA: glycosyltransferase family 4 protein [Vicinamibacterales bacterium]|nr:glycosyltransferase family 4 protein [Vicinamibacterales bacterium]